MERSGRDLIYSIIPVFAWRDWQKPRKSSVSIASFQAEIWTRDLPNRSANHSAETLGSEETIHQFLSTHFLC
jgi:hypothetical protein